MTVAAPPAVAPRFAPPIPTRHRGREVWSLARALGWQFMPWQRRATATLNTTDDAGRRIHPFFVLTVQRQTGKTTWLMTEAVQRCVMGPPHQRVWYTAQSGLYAREKWAELAHRLLAAGSPFAGYVAAKWTNGSECLTFPNGSTIRPFPPTRDALHSMQSDLVIVDETWRHDSIRGAELLQAIGPTQATRPGAQVVLASTAGTTDSTFLRAFVDRGRAGDPAVTYMEYSIPDDADPDDLDVVTAYHPAIGHTIDRTFLEREQNLLSPNEFARAYGNAWTATVIRHIDPAVWESGITVDPLPGQVAPVFAADIAADRSRGAILAAAGGIVEVVESRPGVSWMPERLAALKHRWRPPVIMVDPSGPAATLADVLTRAKIAVATVKPREYVTACPRMIDRLSAGTLRYRRHPALDAAAVAAVPRQSGDGWCWSRRSSAGPIPELVAMTLAAWADEHRPAAGKPMVISAR